MVSLDSLAVMQLNTKGEEQKPMLYGVQQLEGAEQRPERQRDRHPAEAEEVKEVISFDSMSLISHTIKTFQAKPTLLGSQ